MTDTDAQVRAEMHRLKLTNLSGWRTLGKKLLQDNPPRWELCKDFMDRCPKAAADARGAIRRKLVESADAASEARQNARRQKDAVRQAFARKPNERQQISDDEFKDR